MRGSATSIYNNKIFIGFAFIMGNKKDYDIFSFCYHYENLGSVACLGGNMCLFGIFGYIEFVWDVMKSLTYLNF